MKNHKSQPTGTTSFLEANVVNFNHGRGHDGGRGWDSGREINNYYFRVGCFNNSNFKRTTWNDYYKGKTSQNKNS